MFKNATPHLKEMAKKAWEKAKDYAKEHKDDIVNALVHPHKNDTLPAPYTAKPKTSSTDKSDNSKAWILPVLAIAAAGAAFL